MNNKEIKYYAVYVDDVLQKEGKDFEYFNGHINFKFAPEDNTKIKIYELPEYKDKND